MNFYKNLVLSCILIGGWIWPPRLAAQSDLPTKVLDHFNTFQEEFPVEKAYLQLDKYTYLLGENIWFSAYVMAGSYQVPSPMSKTLYVDFFDGDGLLLGKKVVKIENGRGSGDFLLPRQGRTGEYQIRAYTNWMRNFGEEYFFKQTIRVVDNASGSFLPEVKFNSIQTENGRVKYDVDLIAINSLGQPLSNQSIDFSAFGEDLELFGNNLRLNDQGQVNFSFFIPAKPYPNLYLELTYEKTSDSKVIQKIGLPYSLELVDVQFLPEGGDLVLGQNSVIGIKATNPDGSPAVIRGHIKGEEESSFSTNERGLGKMELTPTKSQYFAEISSSSSEEIRTVDLPEVLTNGLTIQVRNHLESTHISALVQGKENGENLYLLSHTRGKVNFLIQGKIQNGLWGVRIPKESLSSGINTITVFSEDGKPLLERLTFVANQDLLNLEIKQKEGISPKGKIQLELESAWNGNPVPGSFSISVSDAEQVEEEGLNRGTIFSHLLLSSDLKGTIVQPGFYFQDQSPETMEELDLVMLTHGWRRFDWENIVTGEIPENNFYIEQGITIQGQILEQYQTKKGLGGGKINVFVDKGIELLATEYGPDGKFLLPDLDFSDSLDIAITAKDSRRKNFIDLKVDRPNLLFSTMLAQYPRKLVWPKGLADTYSGRILMNQLFYPENATDLDEVTVSASRLAEERFKERKIYGDGDRSLKLEDLPGIEGYYNIFQILQGRFAGVYVNYTAYGGSVRIRGGGSPLFLVDNVPSDPGLVSSINPRDVYSIDLFKDPSSTAIFGVQGGSGVIVIYTKHGMGPYFRSVGGHLNLIYGGYSISREFYSPKYDSTNPPNFPDLRATLFWKPIFETGQDGKYSLEFYNSDIAKKLLIVVEGTDAQGRLGRIVKMIEWE